MSRAIVPTTSLRQPRPGRRLWMLAVVPLLLVAACSSGDDNGGTPTQTNNPSNPPSQPPAADAQNAYAIASAGSTIQAYRVDGSGVFTPVGLPVATGTFPHHVNVDPRGRFVYVSNHESPFLSGWRIAQDASLVPIDPAPGSPVTGTDPSENESHSSVLDQNGQFLYVVSGTGASTLRAYVVDQTTGALTFIPGQSFPVGTHAHNVTLSPNNQFLYVASDGSGEVYAFRRDTSTGALTPVGTVTGLPVAESVRVDPQSRFLFVGYASGGGGAVEVLAIGPTGAVTRITPTSTFLTNQSGPHALALHPNGQTLYVANINSNTITVFRVDPNTGALAQIQTPQPTTGDDPNYIVLHPNGRMLFTADAASDQISRFTVNPDGTLVPAGAIPAGDGANGLNTTRF